MKFQLLFDGFLENRSLDEMYKLTREHEREVHGIMKYDELFIYNPDATCPKCGGKKVTTNYAKYCGWMSTERFHCRLFWDKEHMHRCCSGCGYTWCERPLDAKIKDASRGMES